MDYLNLDESKHGILGVLDELNSFIGFAKCFAKRKNQARILTSIQNHIFLIQAEIANPPDAIYKPQRLSQDDIRYLEKETFLAEKNLKKIDHFIIPEGDKFACVLHCVRTLSRRAERKIIKYGKKEKIKLFKTKNTSEYDIKKLSQVIDLFARYFDRVACFAYASARLINKQADFQERKPEYYLLLENKNSR